MAWFVGKNVPPLVTRSHAPGCPFGDIKRSASNGGNQQVLRQHDPSQVADPFIPDEILAGFRTPRRWPVTAPSLQTILTLVRGAINKPIEGTIEHVVDAYSYIQKHQLNENAYPLNISGNQTNYCDGIIPLKGNGAHANEPDFWKEHIIACRGFLKSGSKGAIVLFPVGREFTIIIDTTHIPVVPLNNYVHSFINKWINNSKPIMCYFWNIIPIVQQEPKRPTFHIASRDAFLRTAFREIP